MLEKQGTELEAVLTGFLWKA